MGMFQVRCKKEHGQYNLSVTHNGWQWTSIRLENQHQMQAVINCLYIEMKPLDIDDYYDPKCICGTKGFKNYTGGCPVHGVKEWGE
jgi:hypothetical protein